MRARSLLAHHLMSSIQFLVCRSKPIKKYYIDKVLQTIFGFRYFIMRAVVLRGGGKQQRLFMEMREEMLLVCSGKKIE